MSYEWELGLPAGTIVNVPVATDPYAGAGSSTQPGYSPSGFLGTIDYVLRRAVDAEVFKAGVKPNVPVIKTLDGRIVPAGQAVPGAVNIGGLNVGMGTLLIIAAGAYFLLKKG